MAEKSGRTAVNASISFPPALLEKAKQRASNLGLQFSTYIQKLLERDLAERSPLVLNENLSSEENKKTIPGKKKN